MTDVLAGKLRHRITIERNTPTRNALGEAVDGWATLATRWASVRPLKGAEYWEARQLNAERTVRFGLRYDPTVATVTPRDRITWGTRTFDIDDARNLDERNRRVELVCTEVA